MEVDSSVNREVQGAEFTRSPCLNPPRAAQIRLCAVVVQYFPIFCGNQFFVGHAIAVLEHENGFLFGLLSNIVGTFELSAPGSIRTTGLLGLPCYMMHPVASRSITLG